MIDIINLKLRTVNTTEVILPNKRPLSGEKVKFNFSRRCRKNPEEETGYIGECVAELILIDEEDTKMDNRTFYVKVALNGTFSCEESPENITDEKLHAAAMFELLPHVRACLASTMTNAGLTPYIIPSSIIPELA